MNLEQSGMPRAAPIDAELLRLVVESATDFAIIGTDAEGRITVWNTGAEHLFGFSEQEMRGVDMDVIFTVQDRAMGVVEMEKRRALAVGRADDERWHLRRDGSRFWGSGLMMPMASPAGGFVKIVRDRTAQREAEQQLRETEWTLRTLVEGMPQLVWRSCDMGRWTWASPQWLAHTGQSEAESLGHGWQATIHPEDRAPTMEAWELARPTGMLDMEFRVRRVSDGAYIWHRTRSLPVRDGDGRIVEWLGTTTDVQDLKELQRQQQVLLGEVQRHARALEAEVEERKQAEAQLLHAAYHDDLTKLRNRAYFMGRLRRALDRQDVPAPRCAVLFMDLDRFKLVNDSLGHQAGNTLLVEVAQRLQACTRSGDTLARVGGDEFAVLVEGFDGIGAVSALADRLIGAMARPVWLGTQEVFPSLSIGIVEADGQRQPDELLCDADVAMYHAKRNRGSHALFTDSLRDSAVEALQLRTDLRNALTRNEFMLDYQPICHATTGAIMGMEALIRWNHPKRGLVPPTAFIGVTEETGMIRDLGCWVLLQACTQMRAWQDQRPGLALRLSVNASGSELMDNRFAANVQRTLAATGLDPRCLQLEVTESVFLKEPELVGGILASIRALGVRIALDDFGTGYSSLSYLSRYQVDTLKVDRSFVAQMLTEPRTAAVVETVVRLGQALGCRIVAEGVENGAQLQALRAMGCDLVQGYWLGRPMPPDRMSVALDAPGEGGQAASTK